MNNIEHIALANGVNRRLTSNKVLDAICADLALASLTSPFGAERRSEPGGALPFSVPPRVGAASLPAASDAPTPLLSIGPSGLGGPYQTEIFGPEL